MSKETKIFDPRDPATGTGGAELLDSSVVKRGDQWWLFLAGQAEGFGPPEIFSASLPPGASLTPAGWNLNRTPSGKVASIAGQELSKPWDGNGGRHCPSYVRGWDPAAGKWVERIYYAGGAGNIWGPYTIGYLEWDGTQWLDQAQPVFVATEEWERGSVFEPNLIYHDGRWKLWYVAGSHHEDHLVHGYAESDDGKSGWSNHQIFAPPEMKMFDFCIRPRGNGFDAIYSRIWVAGGMPPFETGLWWCHADHPSATLADWGKPIQIMTAADKGWHYGPWKPSFQFPVPNEDRALVFFDGLYKTSDPGPFPYCFTLGCLEIDLPLNAP